MPPHGCGSYKTVYAVGKSQLRVLSRRPDGLLDVDNLLAGKAFKRGLANM